MPFVADLHIHSKYSNACSANLGIPNLAKWAKYKGIDLLGTGDFLHPLWQQELKKYLKEESGGFYQYQGVKFAVTAEISCIYTEDQKSRRIHTLVFLPSLDSAFKLSETLTKMGCNLKADGRPIIGLSSKKLCEVIFKIEPEAIIIPAHIWTPWYSLYGSNSGYDNLEDCFGEFSDQIYAVETGLSSDPAMNWRIADLDQKTIVSFSDLHSLPRMGREATIFMGDLNYKSLKESLISQNLVGTIEFFPEEGKYHYSGHRNCNVVFDTQELAKNGLICPVCKSKLTIGVTKRIEDLATRSESDLKLEVKDGVTRSETFPKRPPFRMLVQLEEILSESMNLAVKSSKVQDEYLRLVTELDSELKILTKTKIELIALVGGEKLAEGIKKVRDRDLNIEPGFDNTYGKVKIW